MKHIRGGVKDTDEDIPGLFDNLESVKLLTLVCVLRLVGCVGVRAS